MAATGSRSAGRIVRWGSTRWLSRQFSSRRLSRQFSSRRLSRQFSVGGQIT
jgi:hypothetical protein